jgi:hypothetical protein
LIQRSSTEGPDNKNRKEESLSPNVIGNGK